jgi:hypothetical protein
MSPSLRPSLHFALAAVVVVLSAPVLAAPHGEPARGPLTTLVAADRPAPGRVDAARGNNDPSAQDPQLPDAQTIARQARVLLSRPVDVFVLKQELAPVVQTLAEQAGIRVTLGKGLTRPLSNLHLKGTAAEALDTLTEALGAVWWWSGTDVRIVDRSDLVTKTLKTREFDRTLAAARSLGIPIDLITAQKADGPGIVRVTGPSGLVAEVEALIKDVTEQDGKIHVTRYGRRRSATIR